MSETKKEKGTTLAEPPPAAPGVAVAPGRAVTVQVPVVNAAPPPEFDEHGHVKGEEWRHEAAKKRGHLPAAIDGSPVVPTPAVTAEAPAGSPPPAPNHRPAARVRGAEDDTRNHEERERDDREHRENPTRDHGEPARDKPAG